MRSTLLTVSTTEPPIAQTGWSAAEVDYNEITVSNYTRKTCTAYGPVRKSLLGNDHPQQGENASADATVVPHLPWYEGDTVGGDSRTQWHAH